MSVRIRVEMKPAEQIIKAHGLDKDGRVQLFHTMNVSRRITRYMPYRRGDLSTKLKRVKTPTEIVIDAPYAKYQYYGKLMVGKAPKVVTDKPLNQRPHSPGNERAGPFWDRALIAAEGDKLRHETQQYIKRKG